MKNVIIQGSEIFSIADIHEKLMDELGFPEYYGMNLDALHDCLTDIFEETCISIVGSNEASEKFGADFDRFMQVLNDAAEENDNLYIIEL